MKIKRTSDALERTLDFLVFGSYGTGKTYSLRTLPCEIDEILILNTEDGFASLADLEVDYVDVFTFEAFESVMHELESDPGPYKWIVLDSGSKLAELMVDEFEEKIASQNKSGEADGRQVYGAMAKAMQRVALSLIRSPFNTVMTARMQKAINAELGINLWCPAFPGKALIKDQIIPHMYDSVFAAIDTGEEYVWQTRGDDKLDARCRWGCLDDVVAQDFAEVVNTIHSTMNTNKKG